MTEESNYLSEEMTFKEVFYDGMDLADCVKLQNGNYMLRDIYEAMNEKRENNNLGEVKWY